MFDKHIVFENDGVIDLRVVSTFGCSVKESDNPIGYFGTGMKYAIAILLRLNQRVFLKTDGFDGEFTVIKDTIRGKEFSFVSLDGKPLGFTTELGKNWELWMAYRELFCNAKDEAGCNVFESAKMVPCLPGKTRFIVQGNDFARIFQNHGDYFITGRPLAKMGGVEVFGRPSQAVYYKGIRIGYFQNEALFTYNLTENITLTEDRTVQNHWEVLWRIGRAYLTAGTKELLEKSLVAAPDTMEHGLDFFWDGEKGCPEFFAAVENLQRSEVCKVNGTALRFWREKGQGYISPRRITPTDVQSQIVERAISACKTAGYDLQGEYPIILVESLGEQVLAMADIAHKQIFLSQSLLDRGTKFVAAGLIEEYIHLRFGLHDATRGMQNHLFERMMSLVEEIRGEPI